MRHNTQFNRREHSLYHTLMKSAEEHENDTFFRWTRMSPALFHNLVKRLKDSNMLTKQDTQMRKAISIGNKYSVIKFVFKFYFNGINFLNFQKNG